MSSSRHTAGLPTRSQPDALPKHLPPAAPSIWVYIWLILAAALLAGMAFLIEPDLPSLLYSLASSLIAAVVLLIFVDQRLRASDVHRIQNLPSSLRGRLLTALFPRYRQLREYTIAFLGTLKPNLEWVVEPPGMNELLELLDEGFILQGHAATGKTTQLQLVAARVAERFVAGYKGPSPVLFPLRLLRAEDTLYDTIRAHVNSHSPVTDRAFRKALTRGEILLILDGADEVFVRGHKSLGYHLRDFQDRYGASPLVLSTRTSKPAPDIGLPVVPVRTLTDEQIESVREFRSRYAQ